MSSGGQQPVTQQTQQTRDPWATAQPALTRALGMGETLAANDQGYQPWTGATQAPLNADLQTGLNNLGGMYAADIGGTQGVNAGRALGTEQIQDRGLSPELQSLYQQAQGDQNPYLQSILDTNNRRIGDRVNSSVSGAGRYGSGAHTDIMSRALAESADPVLAQDYARRQQQMQDIATGGLQRAGQWAQLMPSLDEARLAGAQGLMTKGQYLTDRDQAQLADQIKLYNAQQARPWEQAARLNAIAGQAGALGGTQFGTQTTPINQPSTLQKLFGGAAAGAGIGGSFGGLPGAGIGALGGSLLGLL
jgi:hypothetical protein